MTTSYVIKDYNKKISKNGTSSWGELTLQPSETQDNVICKIWENDLQKIPETAFRPGNLIKLVNAEYKAEYRSYNAKGIEVLTEAAIGLSVQERNRLFELMLQNVKSFEDKSLSGAMLKIITENENLFKVTPAAKNNHHNYVGGLLQHVSECLEIAKTLFPLCKQPINTDNILAACIMHDFGKIFEYKIDVETGLVDYVDDFKKEWITHSQFGFTWAMSHGLKELARIIAAHHGRADWGAIIDLNEKNIDSILYMMHHIDDLSAKFGMITVNCLTPEKV